MCCPHYVLPPSLPPSLSPSLSPSLPTFPLGQVFGQRVIHGQLPILDQLHDGHGGNGLAHGEEATDAVGSEARHGLFVGVTDLGGREGGREGGEGGLIELKNLVELHFTEGFFHLSLPRSLPPSLPHSLPVIYTYLAVVHVLPSSRNYESGPRDDIIVHELL